MRRCFLLFLLLYAHSLNVVAETVERLLTVDGYGSSLQSAVQNALIESIKQSNGISVDSQQVYSKAIHEQALSTTESDSHDVLISNESTSNIKEATEGTIDQYAITMSEKLSDGQWHARVDVKLIEYLTPGISPHALRKIASLPVRTEFSKVSIFDKSYSAEEIARQYNQRLITELTQSRRFSVIDRDYAKEYAKERTFLLSSDTSPDEYIKLGQALGVDYLLLGTINEFKAETISQYSKTLGQKINKGQVQLNADFRIMVMATRQIKWSDTIEVFLDQKEINAFAKTNDDQGLIDYVLEKAAQKVVHSSLNNIYPLRVLKVANNSSIYLNQGGKLTKIGDTYEVFTPGEKVVDPETGQFIPIDGDRVATVQITQVSPKYSSAKLVDGNIDRIQTGAICRKRKLEIMQPKRQQEVTQPAW